MRLFEISWEVCNKVGGIHTVISSKARYIKEHTTEYYCIGPYFRENINSEFKEEKIPKEFEKTVEDLKSKKIFCHFGSWKTINVKTFLIDFSEFMAEKNGIKTKLWEDYKIDSLHSTFWFDEPVVWSYAVGLFLEKACENGKKTVAHFHEWLTGAALLYLKKNNVKIGKVFTTHATVLGRAMAARGEVYTGKNSDEAALKLEVIDKHLMEKKAALNAEVFTTVSEITAKECERVLGRKPKTIINGIDLKIMPSLAETPKKHKINREKIKELVVANFFPHYPFDVENSLFCYISGRYEIISKGIEIYIKALGNLNKKLRLNNSKKNIVAFLLIPSNVNGVNTSLLKDMAIITKLKKTTKNYSKLVEKKGLDSLFLERKNVFSEEEKLSEIKKENPQISTHVLCHEDDFILKMLKEAGLENKKEDRVKVIFYPAYLDKNDGVFNTDYYNIVSGFDLGIFPSFYEPWGYTPVENAALGVATITTDLAGFGKFTLQKERGVCGIKVLKREGKNNQDIIKKLQEEIYSYLNLKKEKTRKNKIIAQKFTRKLSWDKIINNYISSYEESLKKIQNH